MAEDGGEVDAAVPDFILVQLLQCLLDSINDVEELSLSEITVVVYFLPVSILQSLGDEFVVHLDFSRVLVGVDVVLLQFYWVIERVPKWLDFSLSRVSSFYCT